MHEPINPQIEPTWKQVLWDQFQAPYFAELKAFLVEEKKHYVVFPKSLSDVKQM